MKPMCSKPNEKTMRLDHNKYRNMSAGDLNLSQLDIHSHDIYVLNRETIHNHDRDGDKEHETLMWFTQLKDALKALETYLEKEYGNNYKTDVFESVRTYTGADYCGNIMIEAIDLEGDETLLWIQCVPMGT